MASIRDLLVTIKYQVDKTSEKNINDSIDKIKKNLASIGVVSSPFANIATDIQNVKTQTDDLGTSLGNAVQMFNQYAVALQNVANNIAQVVQMTPANFWAYLNNQATNNPFDMQALMDALDDISEHIDTAGESISSGMSSIKSDLDIINLKSLSFKGTILDIEGILRRILSLGALKQAASIVEDFTQVNLKLNSTAEWHGEDTERARKTVLDAANGMRTDYRTLANQTVKLMNSTFGEVQSSEGATEFVGTVIKALRASGLTASEYNGIVDSVTSDLINLRTISGSTFQKLFSEAPMVEDYFRAAYPGWDDFALRKIQQGGQVINFHEFYDVFMSNADDIDKRFSKVKLTITDTLTYIKNDFGYFLNETDDGMSIMDDISHWLIELYNWAKEHIFPAVNWVKELVDSLGGIVPVLQTILGIMVSIKAVNLAISAIGAVKTVSKVATAIKTGGGLSATVGNVAGAAGVKGGLTAVLGGVSIGSAIAIVGAVVAAIATIVDFFRFLKGESSIWGKLFDSIGFGADSVREKVKATISDLGDRFKDLLPTIKTLFSDIWSVLVSIYDILKPIISIVLAIFGPSVSAGLKIVISALNLIIELLDLAVKPFKELFDSLIRLMGFGDEYADGAQPFIEALKDIGFWIDAIGGFIANILDTITALLKLAVGEATWKDIETIWKKKGSSKGAQVRSFADDSSGLAQDIVSTYTNSSSNGVSSTISKSFGKNITVNQTNNYENTYNVESREVAKVAYDGQQKAYQDQSAALASMLQRST